MSTTERPFGAEGSVEEIPPPPELESLSPRRPGRTAPPRQVAEGWLALLNNRFILAALSVVVVLLLTTVVLVAIGQGGADTGGSPPNAGVLPNGEKTPARPLGGLAGTTTATATYRNGPGPTYSVLGTIPRGAVVTVVGRNQDESWLQVRYPPNSNLRGWVDAKLLDVDGDVTKLAISGPGPLPQAEVTFIPTSLIYEPPATETSELEPTRVTRPTRTPPRPTVTPYRPPPPTATIATFPTGTPPLGP